MPFQVKSIKSSIEYYENEGLLDEQEKLIATGHSLGGALSEITDVMYNDRLIQGLNFNGPGVKRLFKDKDNEKQLILINKKSFKRYENLYKINN